LSQSAGRGKVSRRIFLGTVGALAGALGYTGGAWAASRSLLSQTEASRRELEASNNELLKIFTQKKVATGGGILSMFMLDSKGNPTVRLGATFAFGPSYVLFDIESFRERLLLHTAELGDLTIDSHSFTLSLAGSDTQVAFEAANDGLSQAVLTGEGGCGVSGTSSDSRIGGKDLKEVVKYEATAVDGGRAVPDRFSVKVSVDKITAPTLYSIFGKEETFSGQMFSGKIIVEELSRLPI
jgi:hypothetical protein